MVERNKYGIPIPSGPMALSSHGHPTPEQEEEAVFEAEAEARLFLSQEEDYEQT